ncbi:MAG: hypothetical protein NTY51_08240 [Deltaproteobacteria bacterium]|nr:hypothetical protein [Deltaproteobacteria bacterium]
MGRHTVIEVKAVESSRETSGSIDSMAEEIIDTVRHTGSANWLKIQIIRQVAYP